MNKKKEDERRFLRPWQNPTPAAVEKSQPVEEKGIKDGLKKSTKKGIKILRMHTCCEGKDYF